MSSIGKLLIITEKPSAAKRVAEALSDIRPERIRENGVEYYIAKRGNRDLFLCPALGHLFTLYDTINDRSSYPVFDLEWKPLSHKRKKIYNIIRVLKKLSSHSTHFVNACDYDIEGDTIGYNILKYVCTVDPNNAFRMKFSSLTKDEIVHSFEVASRYDCKMALAGRIRHFVDFVWGINLSRNMMKSFKICSGANKTFSIGRVQGPTLNFIYEREIDAKSFVPRPYWKVIAEFNKDGRTFRAVHIDQRIETFEDVKSIMSSCQNSLGLVTNVENKVLVMHAPPPFNLIDLQRTAFFHFGFSPTKVERIAESLYLKALISYPRTDSQKLPKTDLRELLGKIALIKEYADAKSLLIGRLMPVEGKKDDPAHPCIFPTGDEPKNLSHDENLIFDLIVRRFIACFGPPLRRRHTSITIMISDQQFVLKGVTLIDQGWTAYYKKYWHGNSDDLPQLNVGDKIPITRIIYEEKFDAPPEPYTQGSLLAKMQAEGLGTKATRGEIISILYKRKYVSGRNIQLTQLGWAVVESMRYCVPEILTADLTRKIEEKLLMLENGTISSGELCESVIDHVLPVIIKVRENEHKVGSVLCKAVTNLKAETGSLGTCPLCKDGKLRIKSDEAGKRFIECENSSKGCRNLVSLPQTGSLNYLGTCDFCGWPIVKLSLNHYNKKFCLNKECAFNAKKHEM